MAAGVGKTYSMLSEARAEKERGIDVVSGYVESHGRIETESLLEGIESLPLLEIVHRGVRIKEFSLDAALARCPRLLLVDELAHSNAPGCRHSKRWQDIEELLDSGIDVYTTVNIQHVESLRDVVAQITGVYVKETVPDAFFDRANDIELVDLPPQELHQRLRDGKVYIQEKVEQALGGFFKKSNLLALRELALRHTAERVDEEMRRVRELHSNTEKWHTRERILVCIAPNMMASRVVREARRLASSLHAHWYAITVDDTRSASLSNRDHEYLEYAVNLAETLGAEVATLGGEDVVGEVIRFARDHNVTTIVVGKPVRARWRELLSGSVVDSLIRLTGDIDVLVITGAEEQSSPLIIRKQSGRTTWIGYLYALGAVTICTIIGLLMIDRFDLANIVMVYLLGVVVTSATLTKREAMTVAVTSVALFDLCFVHPRGTFAVRDAQYIVTFVIMLGVSILINSLTQRLKDQSMFSAQRERSTSTLYSSSRQLAPLRDVEDMVAVVVTAAANSVNCEVAVLAPDGNANMKVLSRTRSEFESDPHEQGVSRWVVDNARIAGRSTDTLSGSRGLHLPLIGSTGVVGTMVLDLKGVDTIDSSRMQFLESLASQLASGIERAKLTEESHKAALRIETEAMRSDLLSAVSHDLRTPLAAIEGAASSLVDQPDLAPRGRELAQTVFDQSERMSHLIRNLLDMTRVQGSVELNLDWHGLDELIANAIERTETLFKIPVEAQFDATDLVMRVDGVLIEQVLVNVLENAARYAGENAGVVIKVTMSNTLCCLDVSDNGPGLSESDLSRIFERFYKKSDTGFGLGLAICKAAIEAHRGKIRAQNNPNGGLTIHIELPISESQADE
jgi:two-component system sensor histidine kinase KdpD